jgi:hypothetical protein
MGLYIANSNQGPVNIVGNFVSSTLPDFNVEFVRLEKVSGGNGNMNLTIDQNIITGDRILVLKTVSTFTTPSPNVSFTRNDINISLAPISDYIVGFFGGNHKMIGNKVKFKQDPAFAFVNLASGGANSVFDVSQNKFIHETEGQSIVTNADTATNVGINLNQNSFLSTSTVSNGNSRVIYGFGAGSTNVSGSGLPSPESGNKVCETTPAHGWSGGPIVATSFMTLSVPTVTPVNEACY